MYNFTASDKQWKEVVFLTAYLLGKLVMPHIENVTPHLSKVSDIFHHFRRNRSQIHHCTVSHAKGKDVQSGPQIASQDFGSLFINWVLTVCLPRC